MITTKPQIVKVPMTFWVLKIKLNFQVHETYKQIS
jgi:hypothetical protein